MKSWCSVSVIGAMAILAASTISPARAESSGVTKIKQSGAVSSIWVAPKEAGTVAVIVPWQANPLTLKYAGNTVLGGICNECQMYMTFTADGTAKPCTPCGCGLPSAQCVAGKPVKPKTAEAFLAALPRGVALRVAYNTPDKPDSGVKSLLVDRHTALLPVDGLNGQTPDQLLALVKPVGGIKAELVNDGKMLMIDLKLDWTAEHEAQFEKALVKAGGKLTYEDATSAAAAVAPHAS